MPSYHDLLLVHLWTVVPCFFIGTAMLLLPKGTPLHKGLGKVYMILMFFTAIVTLFMSAQVGPTLWGHFGYIHLFTFLTLWTVPTAWIAAKRGQIKVHKRKMIGLYFGALVIAGGFTFFPGRYLHTLIFAG